MNTEHTNQSSQGEPVNQQLLALVKSFGHKTGCAKNAFGELCTCGVDEAIAAAEQAQQAEPVACDEPVELDDEDIINIADANGFDINTPGGVIELCKAVASYAAQPPAVAAPLALPEWMECDAKVQAGTANALERFIAANEPAGDSAAEFRAALLAILAAAPQAAPLSAALADIAAERRRQIEQEGWTPEHDDKYRPYVLSGAAGCYAMHTLAYPAGDPPSAWPFAASWWKPSADTRRNLVKAGALIAAEIERIDRAAQKGGEA